MTEKILPIHMKKKKFDANLYSAYMTCKASKAEEMNVLTEIIKDSRLAMKMNLAAAVCKKII